jgi:hypothetical protein
MAGQGFSSRQLTPTVGQRRPGITFRTGSSIFNDDDEITVGHLISRHARTSSTMAEPRGSKAWTSSLEFCFLSARCRRVESIDAPSCRVRDWVDHSAEFNRSLCPLSESCPRLDRPQVHIMQHESVRKPQAIHAAFLDEGPKSATGCNFTWRPIITLPQTAKNKTSFDIHVNTKPRSTTHAGYTSMKPSSQLATTTYTRLWGAL